MLFYILFAFCVTFLLGIGFKFPNTNKFLLWFVYIILICVAGFRHHVGIDYDWYLDWYVNKSRDNDLEFGFVTFMNLFRALNSSYQLFFLLFSIATISFAFFGIKNYTKNTNIAFLFFFLIPELYLASFNLIRQSFSVCISFYAFYFLINKKYFLFSILMLLGLSIHNSTILALLIFLIVYKYADKITAKHIGFLLIFSLVLSYFDFMQIFEFVVQKTRYSYYYESPRIRVSIAKTLVLNSIAFFVLFYFNKMKEKYPYQKYILILYFCSVLFMNLFNTFANVERLTYFFKIFEIIVVADLIFLMVKENRVWLFSCFFVYYLSSFAHTLNRDLEIKSSSKLIPYQTFLLIKS